MTNRSTRELAEWIVGSGPQSSPSDQALAVVELSLADTIACALAGSREPGPLGLKSTRPTGASLPSSLWGMATGAAPRDAAMINGMLAHMLDFDDGDVISHIHPSCILVPALLAVAEQRRLSGRAVLEAYLAGYYVMQVVGQVASAEMAKAGLLAIGLVGSVGAAASLSRLAGLTVDQTVTALGIAASNPAGGVASTFGTDMKAFNIGRAAACGVDAVELALAGVTAPKSILEERDGFVWAFAAPGLASQIPAAVDRLLVGGYSIETHAPFIKLYPCCHSAHANITAALRIRPQVIDQLDNVREIIAEGPDNATMFLTIAEPTSGLEGKFSMQAAVATALLDGKAGRHQFTDEAISRPEVQALLRKVKFVTSDRMEQLHVEEGLMPGSVTIKLDGKSLFEDVRDTPGCSTERLKFSDVSGKFRDCAADVLNAHDVDSVLRAMSGFRDIPDVAVVARMLRGEQILETSTQSVFETA